MSHKRASPLPERLSASRPIHLYLPATQVALIIGEISELRDHIHLSQVCKCFWLFYEETDFFRKACRSVGYALHAPNSFDAYPYPNYRILASALLQSQWLVKAARSYRESKASLSLGYAADCRS